jgi:hypothetical protein
MDISLQLGISYFLLLLVFIVVGHGEGQNECPELRCGRHGPAVRFPFRLENRHQDHCGLPGFNLSCSTRTNHTLLALPVSVYLFVKKIDYKSQVIHVYDPYHCFPGLLDRLNLSSSPFHFNQDGSSGYSIFYCTPKIHNSRFHRISCLSTGPRTQVYATDLYGDLTYVVSDSSACTKMCGVQSIPYKIMVGDDKVFEMKWNSTPACKDCEVKGKNCRLKNMGNGSETECFQPGPRQRPKHTIGMYIYIYPSL